jgi:hypothetical protein
VRFRLHLKEFQMEQSVPPYFLVFGAGGIGFRDLGMRKAEACAGVQEADYGDRELQQVEAHSIEVRRADLCMDSWVPEMGAHKLFDGLPHWDDEPPECVPLEHVEFADSVRAAQEVFSDLTHETVVWDEEFEHPIRYIMGAIGAASRGWTIHGQRGDYDGGLSFSIRVDSWRWQLSIVFTRSCKVW